MNKAAENILKVNHAGEYGAAQIYAAQIAVNRLFGGQCVSQLEHMRAHEVEHFLIFDALAKNRNGRTCHALWLWALGGYILGFITALFGEKGIWSCTIAVERNVFIHLEHQLDWTRENDPELFKAVERIIEDEASHRDEAFEQRGSARLIDKLLEAIVGASTNFAIWLSHKL